MRASITASAPSSRAMRNLSGDSSETTTFSAGIAFIACIIALPMRPAPITATLSPSPTPVISAVKAATLTGSSVAASSSLISSGMT